MDAGQVTLDSSMAFIARQLQANTEMQLAVMKKMAESQQQLAEMISAPGVGANINVTA